jgi:arabinose-5-phosphate isomerase
MIDRMKAMNDNQPQPTYAHQVINLLTVEANAIHQATRQLKSDQINQAIEVLAQCRGKVIVTGIGKSGIVARKIMATMTSTGTPAVYLHPADALHGDLGIAMANDVAIVLSYSGETEEVLGLLPFLRRRQIPIIAIVGKLTSSIAQKADVLLDASVDKEACPLNLAPTTSTTVALAIGDALAMTLMQLKGLTPEDFALNHPAGRLGKRLTLRVADLMHSGPQHPYISPEASWLDIITAISQGGLGAINVVDSQGSLLGLITDGDLRRFLQTQQPTNLNQITCADLMTVNPITVLPDTLAYEAMQLMENRPSQISVLPVMNNAQKCIGLIRLHDIVKSGL